MGQILEAVFPNSTQKTASMVLLILVYLLLNTVGDWTEFDGARARPRNLTARHSPCSFGSL